MRLFELGEELRVGLAVSRDPVPHILVNETDDTALCLDTATQNVFARYSGKARIKYAAMCGTHHGVALSGRAQPVTTRALLRLTFSGQVSLSAASYEERLSESRVIKMYHAFPPLGVELLVDKAGPPFWVDNEKLETMVLLYAGSGFRIHRAKRTPHELFVRWNGSELRVSPYAPRQAQQMMSYSALS